MKRLIEQSDVERICLKVTSLIFSSILSSSLDHWEELYDSVFRWMLMAPQITNYSPEKAMFIYEILDGFFMQTSTSDRQAIFTKLRSNLTGNESEKGFLILTPNLNEYLMASYAHHVLGNEASNEEKANFAFLATLNLNNLQDELNLVSNAENMIATLREIGNSAVVYEFLSPDFRLGNYEREFFMFYQIQYPQKESG